jgi:hypothetical protein
MREGVCRAVQKAEWVKRGGRRMSQVGDAQHGQKAKENYLRPPGRWHVEGERREKREYK